MRGNEKQQSEDRKRAAIRRFCELDRQRLIEHDWSDTPKTGLVKVRYKVQDVDGLPVSYRPDKVAWELTDKAKAQ